MAASKPIEIKPGQLMTGLSADSAGIANYITKREWRRVLDRDVRAEGYDGFRPNPMMGRGAQSIPASGVKTRYNNAAVYFNNVCQVGFTATLAGIFTLPAWIQLQADRNRFVVPAGIFSGLSQAGADQNAQDALNAFIQTNMSNGNIFCAGASFQQKINNLNWSLVFKTGGCTWSVVGNRITFHIANNGDDAVSLQIKADDLIMAEDHIITANYVITAIQSGGPGEFLNLGHLPIGSAPGDRNLIQMAPFSTSSGSGSHLYTAGTYNLCFAAGYSTFFSNAIVDGYILITAE